jgi:hypothetical protein
MEKSALLEKTELKSLERPEEIREFPYGRLELVTVSGRVVGRATLLPGWKWSTSLKPIAKTESCQAAHFQYQISGIMHIKPDDGQEFETRAGDVFLLTPGHDAWVVGEEPVVVIDFQGFTEYAKPR